MSRFKRFTHSLASGYLLLGANIFYTLAQVPLALHYLTKEEFGLWALALQISGYLQLIDMGMASSISRSLIDHKDKPETGVYGSIIKTGVLVLLAQGLILVLGGLILGLFLPGLLRVPKPHHQSFGLLVIGQCGVLGIIFVTRIFTHILHAHQRYDASNYCMLGALVIQLSTMWFGFLLGLGLYSLLLAYATSMLFTSAASWVSTVKLKLLPTQGNWGKTDKNIFRELFSFGRELFILAVGWQLVNATQIVVISRALGLEAAAVWSIATRPFLFAQQFVNRLMDFSYSAFSEMIVRSEMERLLSRFRDLIILSGSMGVWAGLAVALCNRDFLAIWTKGSVSWPESSNWLMGVLVFVYSTTRCTIGFVGVTKQVGVIKYVYFGEGLLFVCLSLGLVKIWGMNGVILSALLTDVLCSGIFGFWRTKNYFKISSITVLDWLRWPALLLSSLMVVFGIVWWVSTGWKTQLRFCLSMSIASLVGFSFFWVVGLTEDLRTQMKAAVLKLRTHVFPL